MSHRRSRVHGGYCSCRLQRLQPAGSLVTHADLTSLCDRPWNEIVVDGRGDAYINDIGFDLRGGEEVASGLLALVTPDGVSFPNGMVVTLRRPHQAPVCRRNGYSPCHLPQPRHR